MDMNEELPSRRRGETDEEYYDRRGAAISDTLQRQRREVDARRQTVDRTLGEWKAEVRDRWVPRLDGAPDRTRVVALTPEGDEVSIWTKLGNGNAMWSSGANILSSVCLTQMFDNFDIREEFADRSEAEAWRTSDHTGGSDAGV